MSRKKIIMLIGAAALLIGAGAVFWMRISSEKNNQANPSNAPLKTDDQSQNSDLTETYSDKEYGFSFRYPKDFEVQTFPGEGKTILVEKEKGRGFQVYITPFDEEGPLTKERIRSDIKNLTMDDARDIMIGSTSSPQSGAGSPQAEGERAIIFFSTNESLDTSREVWFVYPKSPVPNGNYLFQITAYAEFDEILSRIMATWQFR